MRSGPATPGESDHGNDETEWLDATAKHLRRWEVDDQAAARFWSEQPAGLTRLRRVLGGLTLVCVLASFGTVLVGWIWELTAGGSLDPADDVRVRTVLVGLILAGFLSYLAYGLASYASIRREQQAALRWLASRDRDQATRGLPPLLLAAFQGPPPAGRLKGLAALVAALVAGFGVIAAPSVYATEPDVHWGVSLGLLVGGLALAALAVVLVVSAHRATRAQGAFATHLAGERDRALVPLRYLDT